MNYFAFMFMFTVSLVEFAKGALYEDKGSLRAEWSVRGALGEVSLGTSQLPPRPPIASPKPSPKPGKPNPDGPKPKRWENVAAAI